MTFLDETRKLSFVDPSQFAMPLVLGQVNAENEKWQLTLADAFSNDLPRDPRNLNFIIVGSVVGDEPAKLFFVKNGGPIRDPHQSRQAPIAAKDFLQRFTALTSRPTLQPNENLNVYQHQATQPSPGAPRITAATPAEATHDSFRSEALLKRIKIEPIDPDEVAPIRKIVKPAETSHVVSARAAPEPATDAPAVAAITSPVQVQQPIQVPVTPASPAVSPRRSKRIQSTPESLKKTPAQRMESARKNLKLAPFKPEKLEPRIPVSVFDKSCTDRGKWLPALKCFTKERDAIFLEMLAHPPCSHPCYTTQQRKLQEFKLYTEQQVWHEPTQRTIMKKFRAMPKEARLGQGIMSAIAPHIWKGHCQTCTKYFEETRDNLRRLVPYGDEDLPIPVEELEEMTVEAAVGEQAAHPAEVPPPSAPVSAPAPIVEKQKEAQRVETAASTEVSSTTSTETVEKEVEAPSSSAIVPEEPLEDAVDESTLTIPEGEATVQEAPATSSAAAEETTEKVEEIQEAAFPMEVFDESFTGRKILPKPWSCTDNEREVLLMKMLKSPPCPSKVYAKVAKKLPMKREFTEKMVKNDNNRVVKLKIAVMPKQGHIKLALHRHIVPNKGAPCPACMAYFQSTLKKLREKRRSGRVDANLEDEDDGPANESAASHAALPHVSPTHHGRGYDEEMWPPSPESASACSVVTIPRSGKYVYSNEEPSTS